MRTIEERLRALEKFISTTLSPISSLDVYINNTGVESATSQSRQLYIGTVAEEIVRLLTTPLEVG